MAPAVLRSLTHQYGGAATPALRDVDLDVEPGLTLLCGASGSGKSTLLRVLNGLVPHFHGGTISGRAHVAGLDVLRTPVRRLARHCGMVFQDPEAQLVGGTVVREVAFGLENLGVPRPEMRRRVEEALALTGIDDLAARAVGTLSGGERQRLAIAAAMAMRPGILALDEPTAQLDAQGAAAVTATCDRLAREGTAVVLAEHRLDALLALAARVVLVDAGRVAPPRPAPDVAARLAAMPQVVELAVRAGWTPTPVDPRSLRGRLPLRAFAEAPAPRGEAAWSLHSVTAGPDRRRPCLHDVSACGGSGEVVAMVGPNGGGKTTLLRVVAGVLAPVSGRAWRRPGRVAYLPQDPGALLHLASVRDEVLLTLRRSGEGDVDDADAVMRSLRVDHLADRDPRDLSSGERQRAAIAAVLCGRPALALLDEPTRGMDTAARAALVARVRDLAASGTSVVVATHDAALVAETAHRVIEVDGGGARDLGTPRRALTGDSPYATQIGALLAGGPVTVEEALTLL